MVNYERIWSPLKVVLLLHFYAWAEPYPKPSKAVDEAISDFLSNDLIYECSSKTGYSLTQKGEALVYKILSTPIPVQVWVDPRFYDVK